MEFVLLGFDQSDSIRQFRFERIGSDHRRTPVVVSADLTLAREYNLQVQNLPLFCREHLSRLEPGSLAAGLVTITAADMAALRMATQANNEEKKPRRVRRVVSNNVGQAWRRPLF